MAHYILLMTLDSTGRERLLNDSDVIVRASDEVQVPGVMGLGLYAVLGDYDFVGIVEAPDNDAAARYSLQFGVRAGVHVMTLPAVPISQLSARNDDDASSLLEGVELDVPSLKE